MHTHKTILITGATSAIGGALAEVYARPGTTLYLHGRSEARLLEVAATCSARGAKVYTRLLDMRNFAELRGWLEGLGPLDLVVVNAGMNTHIGPAGEPEPWAEVEALLDVNLKAAMAIVQSVLPAMRARGSGQIALVSSLAAYFGLPVTPSYCATKAGAGRDQGQRDHAGLCEVTDVRRHARAEAIFMHTRTGSEGNPARLGARQSPYQLSLSIELGDLVVGGIARGCLNPHRALAGVWRTW